MANDYSKMFGEGRIGMAEIQGRRKEQQDWLTAAVKDVANFPNLSEHDRAAVLEETMSMMQTRHGKAKSGGSTANATIAWLDNNNNVQATTANLGDSTSFLVILDAHNNFVSCNLMHALHSPDPTENPVEYQRVRGYVDNTSMDVPFKSGVGDSWRLGSGLAMSRSLGDKFSELYGLSHAAEITVTSQQLAAGQKAFIVVACDGLTELSDQDKVQVSKKDIGTEIAKGMQLSAPMTVLAQNLVNRAYRSGSHDNISVAVFEVTTTPASAAVFDGHDGSNVSFAAGKDFYPSLTKLIKEKLSLVEEEDSLYERSDLAATVVDVNLGAPVLNFDDENDEVNVNFADSLADPNVKPYKKPKYDEENPRFIVVKNPRPEPTAKEMKVIEEIREKTDKFMLEVNAAIVKNLLNSPIRYKLIAQFLKLEYVKADPDMSNRKWSKIILEQYPEKLHAVLNDKKLGLLDNRLAGSTVKSLALQRQYGMKLQEAMKQSHPVDCMNTARAIFKDVKIRKQLEKGHGFWGKIFQLLGLTTGKRLGRFFDAKDKDLAKSRRVKAAVTKKPARKR